MIHLATLLFAYAGFAAICLSMAKHQAEILGRKLTPAEHRRLRIGGPLALGASYASAVAASGWKFGSVLWVGAIMLAALCVTLIRPYRPRWTAPAGAGAAFVGGMLLVSAALVSIK
jgi:hypothetical protein